MGIEIGVSNHFVQTTVDAILGAARTGEVENIYRITTGEQDLTPSRQSCREENDAFYISMTSIDCAFLMDADPL